MTASLLSAQSASLPIYLGTYSKPEKQNGLLATQIDRETGKIGPVVEAAPATNPSFLAVTPDGRFVYAALESPAGAVGAFRVVSPGYFEPLNELPAGGAGSCHVFATGRHVFVANYSGGTISSFPVNPDGSLAPAASVIAFEGSGPDPKRQKKPYAHAVVASPDGAFLYACDLGTDSVWGFRIDPATSKLTPIDPPAGKVPPGSGPRHLVFSPSGDFVYVNNEMGLTVSVFARDIASGALDLVQTLPVLPEGSPTEGVSTAEILMHPTGRWVYVSNRGHDSITVYSVRPDGRLELLENVPAAVAVPRGLGIDSTGRWMVVAGQNDGGLASFRVGTDGRLSKTDVVKTNAVPVCVIFPPVPDSAPVTP